MSKLIGGTCLARRGGSPLTPMPVPARERRDAPSHGDSPPPLSEPLARMYRRLIHSSTLPPSPMTDADGCADEAETPANLMEE